MHMLEYMVVWVGDRPRRNTAEKRERIGASRALLKSFLQYFLYEWCNFLFLSLCLPYLDSPFLFSFFFLTTSRYKNQVVETMEKIFCTSLIALLLHHSPISPSTSSSPCGRQLGCASWRSVGCQRARRGEGGKKIGEMKLVFFGLVADFLAPLLRLSASLAAKRQPSWLIKMFLRTHRHCNNPSTVTAS